VSDFPHERDLFRVTLMIEAAEEALRDSRVGRSRFFDDRKERSVILLDLIHLCESADRLSARAKKANPQVDWLRLSRLRNKGLVHDYPDVNLEDVWRFVCHELPRLRRQLARLKLLEPEGAA
jgi:uncharacterized protein with HEPN domain